MYVYIYIYIYIYMYIYIFVCIYICLSPHYHNPRFYTILKHFKHLKRNHTNNNHLYSPTLNY